MVVAATNVRAVNARVAADALACGRLINVADRPEDGNCVTVAAHHAGALVIAVSAGGVPPVASRIRDAVAERFDARYAEAAARGRPPARDSPGSQRRGRRTLAGGAAGSGRSGFLRAGRIGDVGGADGGMALIIAGLSHNTAPIETRERCVFAAREVGPALERYAARRTAKSSKRCCCPPATGPRCIWSTATPRRQTPSPRSAVDAAWTGLDERLARHGRMRSPSGTSGATAMRSATSCELRRGLDSMVLGEAQIQGQVRDAWEMQPRAVGTDSQPVVPERAGGSWPSARSTGIGHGSASISSAAVQLASKIFGSLRAGTPWCSAPGRWPISLSNV